MKRTLLLIVALSLILPVGCSRTKREDLVVAEVDVKKITVGDFEKVSETMEEKYLPATDDLDGKKELLKHIINKEVMALKAKAAGYEKDKDFVSFWERFKNPFLVAALMDHHVRKQVTVTEEEVDEYFEKMHWEFTLRQLVVAEEEQALELRERALAGEDFADLAKKYSLGPAAENGGFIGASTIGQMHWWVEDELYSMNEGDVSQPLKTSTGYALLKLEKKKEIVPDLDREYAERRLRGIKEKKGMEELKAKVEKDIELTWFPDAVNIAFESLPEDMDLGDIIEGRITRDNAPKLNIPDQYKDMIICQYSDGMYTLRDFEEIYENTGLPARPRRQYGRENIIQAIHQNLFDKILPTYAENVYKILDIPEVRETLDKRKEQFLVHLLYQDQVGDEVAVTEREVEIYYDQHKEELKGTEMRDFTLILLTDRSKAQEVMLRARKGEDFTKLARMYSEDPNVKQTYGKTGLVARGQYPEMDDVAFSLPNEGDISDPIPTSRGLVVLRVDQIEREKQPTLEEAAMQIRRALMEEMAEEILHAKLDKWREDYIVNIYDENLEKAQLKRLKPVD